MAVRVTFLYEPDDADPDHEMGVTEAEFERMSDRLMSQFGAEDIEFEKEDG